MLPSHETQTSVNGFAHRFSQLVTSHLSVLLMLSWPFSVLCRDKGPASQGSRSPSLPGLGKDEAMSLRSSKRSRSDSDRRTFVGEEDGSVGSEGQAESFSFDSDEGRDTQSNDIRFEALGNKIGGQFGVPREGDEAPKYAASLSPTASPTGPAAPSKASQAENKA